MEIQDKLTQTLPAYRQQEEAFAKLAKDGYATKLMALEKSRDRIEKEQDLRAQNYNVASLKASISQSEKKIAQITSTYRSQLQNEQVEAQGQYEKLQQDWEKQSHRHALLELRAPQDHARHSLRPKINIAVSTSSYTGLIRVSRADVRG